MKSTLKPTIGILFIVSILIPSLFLGFFSLRAVDREEAYIEKQLEQTLLAEVDHTVSLFNTEFKTISKELTLLFEPMTGEGFHDPHLPTVETHPLIAVPFLVGADFTILNPDDNSILADAEEEFLTRNFEFLTDEESVPVYENIAIAYKDVIVFDQLMDISRNVSGKTSSDDNKQDIFYNDDGTLNDDIVTQNAIIQFKQDVNVRNKMYEQAEEEGKKVIERNVKESSKKEKSPESIFISQYLTFSEIISRKETGFIPRFDQDTITLFFWFNIGQGYVTGCTLDTKVFMNRLSQSIRNPFSEVRFLTILDEKGMPSFIPQQMSDRNWKTPFVSREISEILPRWEVAAYLTDPAMISSRAQSIAVILWSFIFLFIISIVVGGILILKSFYSEMILAQQKTTFVSNVSHELKTPLTSIRLFAEILKEGRQPDQEKQNKYLEIMVAETDRLSKLINNVLDFSKMSRKMKQYSMEEVDIVELSRETIEDQRLRLEHIGFSLEFSAPHEKIVVWADRESIKQAFLNLISNAEKYSPDTKEIRMKISRHVKNIRIELCDRGIGIPPRLGAKIFKEFYRIDDSLTTRVQGSGLGLSIAQKIIIAHGGAVQYTPRSKGGSIFSIILPVMKVEKINHHALPEKG